MLIYTLNAPIDDLVRAYPLREQALTALEQAKLAHFHVEKRIFEYLGGRLAAKRLMQILFPRLAASDIEIQNLPSGQPKLYVQGKPQGSLSLSHSNGYAVAAFSTDAGDFGVDLEKVEPRSNALLETFFTEHECQAIWAAPPEHRDLASTLVWSAKEAILKARGVGLGVDTRSINISLPHLSELARGRGTLMGFARDDGSVYRGIYHQSRGMVSTYCSTDLDLRLQQRRLDAAEDLDWFSPNIA